MQKLKELQDEIGRIFIEEEWDTFSPVEKDANLEEISAPMQSELVEGGISGVLH